MDVFSIGDLKVVVPGAAMALTAGLLFGGAMQPHLYDSDRPMGPQMFADWAGERSTGPFDPGTSFVAYHGRIPDYVMGSDWKRSMTWSDERAAVSAPRPDVREEPVPVAAPAILTHATYEEPPAAVHVYPSLGAPAPSATSATDAGVAVDDDTLPSEQG